MAALFTIPQTPMTVGQHDFGPFNVAGSINQYLITLNISLWTFTGGLGFSYSVESSQDNGQSWQVESSGGVDDTAIPAKFGKPANILNIACPIRGTGSRKVRFLSTWAKALTISGTIAAN